MTTATAEVTTGNAQRTFFDNLLASPVMQEQITVGQNFHDFSMVVGIVKRFNYHQDRRKRYGFVTVFQPDNPNAVDGVLDVFVHSAGGNEWADVGWDVPGLRRTEYIPSTNKVVFLDDVRPTRDERDGSVRYRADKWILATTASFERVKASIQNRPIFRFVEQIGTREKQTLWEGRNLYELSAHFPIAGKMISYPLEASEERSRYFEQLVGDQWQLVRCQQNPEALGDIRFDHSKRN